MLDLSKYKLDKSTLVIAVSGGSDSMALLDMARLSNLDLVVCHVNYHKRESSNRDEGIVREYTKRYNIPLEVYQVDKKNEGNFQNWARELRYHFFASIYQKYNAKALLVAHHQDDLIETYLFKKKRHSLGTSLCLRDEENIFGLRVIRPLLSYTKKELQTYCLDNNITYGDDETNFLTTYTRNSIRLEIVNRLTDSERSSLLEKMKIEESKWQLKRSTALSIIVDNKVDLAALLALDKLSQNIVLYQLIHDNCPSLSRNISSSRTNDILKQLKSSKPNLVIKLTDSEVLIKAYDVISIDKMNEDNYTYVINSLEEANYPEFTITFEGKKMEGIYVTDEDFPLTIRCPNDNDKIKLKEGEKTVKRLFIDKKVPILERKTWPIICNNKDIILLIPGLYRDYERKGLQNNLYVLKCINRKTEVN